MTVAESRKARLRLVRPQQPEAAAPASARPDSPYRIEGDDPRIGAAADGDRPAAQSLLTELLPRVRNLVRYLLKGDADVEDVTQNSLLEILRSLPNFRGESLLTTWCDRITVRVALRHVRQRRNERERRQGVQIELSEGHGSEEGPERYMSRRQLALILDDVPDDQQQAIVLHHVVGMSVPEVAETLGVPFETARSRLRLGMEKLRTRHGRSADEQ